MESIFPWPPKQGVLLSKVAGGRSEAEKTAHIPQLRRGEPKLTRKLQVQEKRTQGLKDINSN